MAERGCRDQTHFIDFGWVRVLPQGPASDSGHIQITREGVAFGQKEGKESQDFSLKLPQLFLGLWLRSCFSGMLHMGLRVPCPGTVKWPAGQGEILPFFLSSENTLCRETTTGRVEGSFWKGLDRRKKGSLPSPLSPQGSTSSNDLQQQTCT
jgi:hypothetical protein